MAATATGPRPSAESGSLHPRPARRARGAPPPAQPSRAAGRHLAPRRERQRLRTSLRATTARLLSPPRSAPTAAPSPAPPAHPCWGAAPPGGRCPLPSRAASGAALRATGPGLRGGGNETDERERGRRCCAAAQAARRAAGPRRGLYAPGPRVPRLLGDGSGAGSAGGRGRNGGRSRW